MQVILFKNIDRLGMQGDVVNVADGYYRNYLGPHGMAIPATPNNLKRLETKRKRLQEEAAQQVKTAEGIASRLSEVELTFVMKASREGKLFGAVHDREIADQLKAKGFEVERRQVLLEPIKTVGLHKVKVRLHSHVTTEIKVNVEAEGGPEAAEPIPAAAPAAEPEAAPTQSAESTE